MVTVLARSAVAVRPGQVRRAREVVEVEGKVQREAGGAAGAGRGVCRYARRRRGVCGGRGLISLLEAAADIHLL